MNTLPSRIWRARAALAQTFGARLGPLLTGLGVSSLRIAGIAGMALDPLFFPKLRDPAPLRPIVVVGNPRTGTTFLHRFLVSHRVGAGTELWQMLYPSLVEQRLVRPALPLLELFSPTRFHNPAAHETGLTAVETDDASLFFRHFDGFFLYGFLLAFADEDLRHHFDPAVRDTNARDFAWLEALWRRTQVSHGQDRVVAKLFSLGPRLPAFLGAFPQARVLYTARDPLSVLPSAMSLVTGVLDARFGFWRLPEPLRRRYLDRLYTALVELMRRFHADQQAGRIPGEQVYLVSFDRLMRDFEPLMGEILRFLGVEPSAGLRAAITAQARTQRSFQSGHAYDLDRFGLRADRIREDCAFVYRDWL